MKLRIHNDNSKLLKVILEPWATEFELSPNDHIDFASEGIVPNDAYFAVHQNDYGTTVFPEWEHALVHAYDSDGVKID